MNDIFDPNDQHTDAEIASALLTLPEPPAHADSFWSDLDAELDRTTPSARPTGMNGRTQFLLVAAALVIVAGVIGIVANNQPATVEVAQPLTTTTAVPATTAPEVSAPAVTDRYVSEIFRYDVAIPEDFVLSFGSERQVYIVAADDVADDDDELNTALTVTTFFSDNDEWAQQVEANAFQPLLSSSTVEMPLYTETNGTVSPTGGTIIADQYIFEIPEFGERIVRVFDLEDRTILVELADSGQGLADSDLTSLLDGVRLFNEPVAEPTTCSTNGLAPVEAPAELNDAQRTRFDGIMTALTTCDWQLLRNQMDVAFTASIQGDVNSDDVLEVWQNDERYAEPVLRTLYDHLAFPVGFDDEGATWPRGWNLVEGPDAETLQAMFATEYYSEADLEFWQEITYWGFRTGISEDGTWSYFLAGD